MICKSLRTRLVFACLLSAVSCCLPMSAQVYKDANYDYKPSAKGINREPGTPEKPGRDYVFSSPDPLFPFGYWLSAW